MRQCNHSQRQGDDQAVPAHALNCIAEGEDGGARHHHACSSARIVLRAGRGGNGSLVTARSPYTPFALES